MFKKLSKYKNLVVKASKICNIETNLKKFGKRWSKEIGGVNLGRAKWGDSSVLSSRQLGSTTYGRKVLCGKTPYRRTTDRRTIYQSLQSFT